MAMLEQKKKIAHQHNIVKNVCLLKLDTVNKPILIQDL